MSIVCDNSAYNDNFINILVKEMASSVLDDDICFEDNLNITDISTNIDTSYSDNFTNILVEQMVYFLLDDDVEHIEKKITIDKKNDKVNKQYKQYHYAKERTIIDALNEALNVLNNAKYYKDIIYLNINKIKNIKNLLNQQSQYRLKMIRIMDNFRTTKGQKAYLYFSKNKNYVGQFSICVSLVERHNKIEIYKEAYFV